eukprot:9376568-Alexandrium_andersonii.AAC.1
MTLIGRGNSVSTEAKPPAEVYADYLENTHWAPQGDHNAICRDQILSHLDIRTDPFDLHELNAALRRVKPGKAGGPDGLPPEACR